MDQNVGVPATPKASQSNLPVIIVCVTLLLGALLYFFTDIFRSGDSQFENTIVELPLTEIAADIPQDIIIVEDATIISSYKSESDGKVQSTLIYRTKTPQPELAFKYTDYFIEKGWQLDSPFSPIPQNTGNYSSDSIGMRVAKNESNLSV